MKTLEAVDLTKNFAGEPVVDGVALKLEPGEIVGLLGPNGAGKTTTLMMIVGALKPDRGSIQLLGSPFRWDHPEQNQLIGWVPQDVAVYPGLTVRENLAFFGSLYSSRPEWLQRRISQTLEVCDLQDRSRQKAGQLSTGLKRRLSLAVALLHEPRLLVLDEATVGMDAESRTRVLEHLQEVAARGASILFATHLVDEASRLCHRCLFLDGGRLVAGRVHPSDGPDPLDAGFLH